MIDPVNAFEQHVGARLLDFFGTSTPWHRKLWNVGLCLTLREVLETAEAIRASVLNESTMASLAHTAQVLAGADPGAGTVPERQTVQAALKAKPRVGGLDFYTVAQHEEVCRRAYLAHWARALSAPGHPGPERTARAIAAHLLDTGYSASFLHRWWTYHLRHKPGTQSLAELVGDAEGLARARPRRFDVMVPVAKALRWAPGPAPSEWCPPRDVSAWLRQRRFDLRDVRQDGGLLFGVDALDPGAAVIRVSEILDQLKARMAVGTRRTLTLVEKVWVAGEPSPQPLERVTRGVWVEALDREHQVYDAQSTGGIHAAVELLSHLQQSSPGAAVAGGWAAIEALLSEPGNRAGAAERLALLVACSFPRAELTVLSYELAKHDTTLAAVLAPLNDNRARCGAVADALLTRQVKLGAGSASDRAAALRITQLLGNPQRVLLDVQEHAAVALRRLYRQRNLVLHWGKTDAVALRASLRTTAPLVGAGLDRIVHAHYVDRLKPLQLVARARMGLATVGLPNGPRCTEILD